MGNGSYVVEMPPGATRFRVHFKELIQGTLSYYADTGIEGEDSPYVVLGPPSKDDLNRKLTEMTKR